MPNSYQSLQSEFLNSSQFKPYISSIVFTAYKNISYGEELTLDFPLTLLIGKNGTNKSSVLQALYGCPDRKSVGEYWFSTHVDSIENIDGKRPAFFYRYTVPKTNLVAEVLKTRIQKKGDPDYWEPSRPVLEYGMKPMPALPVGGQMPEGRSVTRWNALKKDVLYLDFRAEISAFDKAFFKDDKTLTRPAHRQRLRKQSKSLKEVIDNHLSTKVHYQKERVFQNYTFDEQQRIIVSTILDTNYTSIIYIEHDFYLSGSFSIYVKKGSAKDYSEAFAGSGETSIIRLVYALDKAPKNSLILLDEPETSLHIDAQYRLKDFIIDKIKTKKLQVIISTHSPFFAKNLPENAIKIMNMDESTGRVRIINSAPPDESSFHLGYKRHIANKANVFVEDKLAFAVAQHVFSTQLSSAHKDKVNIIAYTGGKDALLKLAVAEMSKGHSNACFLFDGDQLPLEGIPDPGAIPPADNVNLENILEQTFGTCPKFPLDSGNEDQKFKFYRDFLSFARNRFKYFPFTTPEQFIVDNNEQFSTVADKTDPKKILDDYAKEKLSTSGEVNSQEIYTLQRQLIPLIARTNEAFTSIKESLEAFLIFAPET